MSSIGTGVSLNMIPTTCRICTCSSMLLHVVTMEEGNFTRVMSAYGYFV